MSQIRDNLQGVAANGFSPFALQPLDGTPEIALPIGTVRMGRSRTNDIVILSGTVAKGQARLEVTRDEVEVIDHNSTNGVYVNGVRLKYTPHVRQSAVLRLGDTVHISDVGFRFVVAECWADEPPGPLLVEPNENAPVDAAGWNDEAWLAEYLRWRSSQVARIFGELDEGESTSELTALMGETCSPPMLQWIRRLLGDDDRSLWFLGFRNAFIEGLAASVHGIGPLLVFDITRNHADQKSRDHAYGILERIAESDGADVPTAVLSRVPRTSTSISALIEPVLEAASQRRSTWRSEQFFDLLQRPSFAEVADTLVFTLMSPTEETHFRPNHGEVLTLDGTLERREGEVRIADAGAWADELAAAWREHLADFEIVQPFVQL